MPNINLLPWREERRKELKKEFVGVLGLIGVSGVACVALAWGAMNMTIDSQRDRNAFIQKHIAELELQVKEIKNLKKRRADLLERMAIIQNLQGNRPLITRVFSELVNTLPEGVSFESIQLKSNVLTIQGTAESNNRVSSLMRKLDNSQWFTQPNLTQVKANPEVGEQASDFNMSVRIVAPSLESEEAVVSTAQPAKRRQARKQG